MDAPSSKALAHFYFIVLFPTFGTTTCQTYKEIKNVKVTDEAATQITLDENNAYR